MNLYLLDYILSRRLPMIKRGWHGVLISQISLYVFLFVISHFLSFFPPRKIFYHLYPTSPLRLLFYPTPHTCYNYLLLNLMNITKKWICTKNYIQSSIYTWLYFTTYAPHRHFTPPPPFLPIITHTKILAPLPYLMSLINPSVLYLFVHFPLCHPSFPQTLISHIDPL